MALGFSSMTPRLDANEMSEFVLKAELKAIVTTVVGLHPHGYAILRGPAFEMAASLDRGMSGGPIVRVATGEVVGICSYGATTIDAEPYSFGGVLKSEGIAQVRWD